MESYSGVLFVAGGKYTTYRKIAQDCMQKLKVNATQEFSLYGSGPMLKSVEDAALEFSVPKETVEHLTHKYGSRYLDVLNLIKDNPSLKNPICSCSPTIAAQVLYSIRTEMARTEEDIYERRLGLEYLYCDVQDCRKSVQSILKNEIGC